MLAYIMGVTYREEFSIEIQFSNIFVVHAVKVKKELKGKIGGAITLVDIY